MEFFLTSPYFNEYLKGASEVDEVKPIETDGVTPEQIKSEEVSPVEDLAEQVDSLKVSSEENSPKKIEPEEVPTGEDLKTKIKQNESVVDSNEVQSEESEHEEEDSEPDFRTSNSIRPRMEVVNIPKMEPNAFVCKWTWDVCTNKCALCHNDINSLCIECQADELYGKILDVFESEPDVSCTTSAGECKHVYHSHCITRWTQRRPICPLCGSTWISLLSSS